MDSVLSRKLFREKYIQTIKPQKFNKGGIATLKLAEGGAVFSEDEKLGYMLAPVAASLLQGTRRQGESQLSSLFKSIGEGVSQIPAIGLKMAEIEGKKKTVKEEVRSLTPEEKVRYNLPAQDEYLGKFKDNVFTGIEKQTYSAAESKKGVIESFDKAKITKISDSLDSIFQDLASYGGGNISGVGAVEGILPDIVVGERGRQTRQKLNKLFTTELKEISGSAVTTPEFDRFLKAYGGGIGTASEQTLRSALYEASKVVEKEKERILSTTDPRTVKSLIDEGGVVLKEPPAIIKYSGMPETQQSMGPNKIVLGNERVLKKINDEVFIYDPKIGRYISTEKYNKLTQSKGTK